MNFKSSEYFSDTRSRICILGMMFFISASFGYSQPRVNVYAGFGSVSGNGEFSLDRGYGFQAGVSIPYARNLELFVSYFLPAGMGIDGGIEFSPGPEYFESYESLKFQSLSAGFGIPFVFSDIQRFIPVVNMRFGKSWLNGSSKDGFSGSNLDFGAGLRYKANDDFQIELFYNVCNMTFDKLEINNEKTDINTNVEETITSFSLNIIYIIRFTKNRDTA